jgi:hypothetical protein
MDHKVVTDYTNVVDNAHVSVYIRARPCEDGEQPPSDVYTFSAQEPKKITICDPHNKSSGGVAFQFDRVFGTESDQTDIFETVSKPQVDHCLNGFNSCCFAYGQTGSGKTYSVFGEGGDERGIVPRSIEYLFEQLDSRSKHKNVALAVSFLEIYCDQIRDLGKAYLDKSGRSGPAGTSTSTTKTSDWYEKSILQRQSSFVKTDDDHLSNAPEIEKHEIHEDANRNVFVKDLSVIPVTSPEEVITVVQMGLKLRATHETKMNAVSSRSHTVFTITIVQKDRASQEETTGMLNLVDLAGSERLKKSESEGSRLREALHINSSLSALGKVVMALDPSSPSSYIPYRDSKLTRLLQNSIGGNSYTTLLATIHPVLYHADECLSTLQFANRCRNVQNQPRVNYSGQSDGDKERRIRRLVEEIGILKQRLAESGGGSIAEVLRKLGMDCEVGEDGTIRMADGRVIGADGEMLVGGGGRNGPLGAGNQEVQAGVPELMKQLKRFQKEKDSLRMKVQQGRSDFMSSQQTVRQHQEKAQRREAESRSEIAQLQQALLEKEGNMTQQISATSNAYQNQIQEIVDHNRRILEEEIEHRQLTQRQHHGSSRTLSKRSVAISHAEVVQALQEGQAAELENVRQQYEHYLTKQRSQMAQFVDSFNTFGTRKAAQLAAWRSEAVQLYSCQSMELDALRSHPERLQLTRAHVHTLGAQLPAKQQVPEPMVAFESENSSTIEAHAEHGPSSAHMAQHAESLKQLDAEKEHYKQRHRDEVARHKELRVAFDAQTRTLNRLMKRGKGNK